jgi:hypothetical protein
MRGGSAVESIRVEAPGLRAALDLKRALQGLHPTVTEHDGRAQVEIPWSHVSRTDITRVLNTTANWLADKDLPSAQIHFGDRDYTLLPERDDLRRGSAGEGRAA